jgi:haloacid dehalogenase superfamily, subfamily IA, variant 3 with third motif having DD or ED
MGTVIFDMDGVMFDTEKIFVKAYDYAGKKMGIKKAGYMAMKTLGMNIDVAKKIWLQEFGEKFKAEELEGYTLDFFTQYYLENEIPVKKGLYNLLNYLKQNNYKIAVASSSPKKVVDDYLNNTNITQFFNVIVGGDMLEKSKPEPDIYLLACKLLKEKPNNCFAIEDSKNGLISAYRAGCKTIMVPDMWQCDSETEKILTAKLNNLDEVINFLENTK